MTKPKKVKIGPHQYKILWDYDRCNDSENNYGFTRPDSMEIIIDPENSADRQRETLVHETLHCLFEVLAYEKLDLVEKELEEKIIVTLSPLLLDVLRNNKQFTSYLLGEE